MLRPTALHLTSRITAGLVAAVILAGPILGATPTQPQILPACVEWSVLKGVLETHYAERQAAIGLAQDGRLLEVFSAPDGTTWTLIVTSKDGMSCVLTSGRAWLQHTPPVPGLDSVWTP